MSLYAKFSLYCIVVKYLNKAVLALINTVNNLNNPQTQSSLYCNRLANKKMKMTTPDERIFPSATA